MQMFLKKHDQDLNLVIDVEANNPKQNKKELIDYIFTKSFIKKFSKFFSIYKRWILEDTNMASVWISGAKGSGKSHFLKIITSIIENHENYGEKTIDYLTESNKFFDGFLTADMVLASYSQADVIMVNGKKIIENSLVETLSAEMQKRYVNLIKYNDNINTEDTELKVNTNVSTFSDEILADMIINHIESMGSNYKLVFMVDNLDEYLKRDKNSPNELLKLMKKLNEICKNKVFFLGTGSKTIEEICQNDSDDKDQLSNIFESITIDNTDANEIVKVKLLGKNEHAKAYLRNFYKANVDEINRLLFSTKEGGRYRYIVEEEFVDAFPMIPFQYDIIFKIIWSMKDKGLLNDKFTYSVRSLLEIFEKVIFDEFITGNRTSILRIASFYPSLQENFANDKEFSIINASKNNNLTEFDLDVLKTLFLVKQIEFNGVDVENLTTMLITDLELERNEFKEEVIQSLATLLRENYISQVEENYLYLTSEELEAFQEIEKTSVEDHEVIDLISEILLNKEILNSEYNYKSRYLTKFNQMVDNKYIIQNEENILEIILFSPLNSNKSELDCLQLSMENNNIIIRSLKNEKLLENIKDLVRIKKLIEIKKNKNSKEIDHFVRLKEREIIIGTEKIEEALFTSIMDAEIYVGGERLITRELSLEEKIEFAMDKIIEIKFNKLDYMETQPSTDDIILMFKKKEEQINLDNLANKKALEETLKLLENKIENNKRVSVSELVEDLKLPPYGFVEMDVLFLIANLYKLDEVRLIESNQPLIIDEDTSYLEVESIINNINSNNLQIEVKEKINSENIENTSQVIKELFDIETNDKNVDALMNTFIKNSMQSINHLKDVLIENHDIEWRNPGREIIETYIKELETINNSIDTLEFFEKVGQNKIELLNSKKEIQNILNFYNGEQNKILVNAFQILDNSFYLNLENDSKLLNILKAIRETTIDKPIENIKELESQIETYLEEYDKHFKYGLKKIEKQIYLDKEEILLELNKYDISSTYTKEVEDKYQKLLEDINNLKTLQDIDCKNHKVKLLKVYYLNKIKEFISLKNNSTFISKHTNFNFILNGQAVVLKDDEDIDNFLNEIKKKITSEKEGVDILYLS